VCIARRPLCESCVLVDLCPAARIDALPADAA
jgi:endonuclease III